MQLQRVCPSYNHFLSRQVKQKRRDQPTASKSGTSASTAKTASQLKDELLSEVAPLERGVRNTESPEKLARVMELLKELDAKDSCPELSASEITGDWKLLWTTEKETLFILQRAGFFRTKAGDVWQIIDAKARTLNNIIEFPPGGVFGVTASIAPQESESFTGVAFKFESAKLVVSNTWTIPVPPFGKGWFRTIFIDDNIRVAKDSRKDWLIVERSKRDG